MHQDKLYGAGLEIDTLRGPVKVAVLLPIIANYDGIICGDDEITREVIQKGKEAGFDHEFLKHARKINLSMPLYTLKIVQNQLNYLGYPIKNTKIAVLGLAYKPNVADDRESPSYDLIKRLKNKGADLRIYDPYLLNKTNVNSLKEAIKDSVCVVIATAHDEFTKDLEIYRGIKLLVDGRNCLEKDEINKMGIIYHGIGIR